MIYKLYIHSITIIFILLIMGELLGVVGMLIGVPLYAIIRVLFNFVFMQFQQRYNKYYATEAGAYSVQTLSEIYDMDNEMNKVQEND